MNLNSMFRMVMYAFTVLYAYMRGICRLVFWNICISISLNTENSPDLVGHSINIIFFKCSVLLTVHSVKVSVWQER